MPLRRWVGSCGHPSHGTPGAGKTILRVTSTISGIQPPRRGDRPHTNCPPRPASGRAGTRAECSPPSRRSQGRADTSAAEDARQIGTVHVAIAVADQIHSRPPGEASALVLEDLELRQAGRPASRCVVDELDRVDEECRAGAVDLRDLELDGHCARFGVETREECRDIDLFPGPRRPHDSDETVT
jgi:hypothetical protein